MWFVIEEKVKKFFAVFPKDDVVCEESVKANDSVNYFWNTSRWNGVVRFMNEDYDLCLEKSNQLNQLRKEESMERKSKKIPTTDGDGERTRSGRVSRNTRKNTIDSTSKGTGKIQEPKGKSSKLKPVDKIKAMAHVSASRILKRKQDAESDEEPIKKKKKNKIVVQEIPSSSSSGSDSESNDNDRNNSGNDTVGVSSDSDSCLSGVDDETANLARMYARKIAAKKNEKSLKSFSVKGYLNEKGGRPSSSNGNDDSKSKNSLSRSNAFSVKESDVPDSVLPTASSSHEEDKGKDSEDPSDNKKVGEAQNVSQPGCSGTKKEDNSAQVTPDSDDGEDMFIVADPEDPNACELLNVKGNGTGVFCIEKYYTSACKATSATMAVRRLVSGVCTPKVLTTCSVSGLPPRGKGKQSYSENEDIVKKILSRKGVDAIIGQAEYWEKKNHWRPKKNSSQLRSAMSVRLCEITDSMKAQASS